MDDRGRIYLDPTEEQIKSKKLLKLDELDMKRIRKMNEIQRKALYAEKMASRKKNGPFGKNYFPAKNEVFNE